LGKQCRHGLPVPAVQANACIALTTNVGTEFAKLAATGRSLTQDCIAAKCWQTVLAPASPARRALMLMQTVPVLVLHARQVHFLIKKAPAPKSLVLHVQRVLMPKKVPVLAPNVQKVFMPIKKVPAHALSAQRALMQIKKVPLPVPSVQRVLMPKKVPALAPNVQKVFMPMKKVPLHALSAQGALMQIKKVPLPAPSVQRVFMPKKVPALAPNVQKVFMPMKKVPAHALSAQRALMQI